jgi:hypothetical protein
MFYLVYVSAAVTWFSATELRHLLAGSRARNEKAGITGMLLYKDGNFMQVLEGDETAVRDLLKRISGDLRHRGLLVLCTGYHEKRQFGDWTMGFCDLGDPSSELPAGYSDFLDLPLTDPQFEQAPTRCWELLSMFRQMA